MYTNICLYNGKWDFKTIQYFTFMTAKNTVNNDRFYKNKMYFHGNILYVD